MVKFEILINKDNNVNYMSVGVIRNNNFIPKKNLWN
jgi:hypothetical protein